MDLRRLTDATTDRPGHLEAILCIAASSCQRSSAMGAMGRSGGCTPSARPQGWARTRQPASVWSGVLNTRKFGHVTGEGILGRNPDLGCHGDWPRSRAWDRGRSTFQVPSAYPAIRWCAFCAATWTPRPMSHGRLASAITPSGSGAPDATSSR